MFNRAARIDGKKPPIIPINIEKIIDVIIIDGERLKLNANSENDWKFNVDILMNCKNEARNIPMIPPDIAITSDSIKNTVRMLLRLNPSARSVPISTVRFATAAYIVIVAPIIAPKLKIIVITIPIILMKAAINSDCSSKYFYSIFG